MTIYRQLAEELFFSMDQSCRRPAHEEVSASMRGEMAVLRLLEHQDEALTAGEISRLLSMTTSRIAAVLGSLEKKGMIVRSVDELDKRRIQVTLTQDGLNVCKEKKECAISNMSGLLEALGEEDAVEFVRLMKKVYALVSPLHEKGKRQENGI